MKLATILLLCVTAMASTKKPKHIPVLPGSHESMVKQNEEIDRLLLPRIVNDVQLLELERNSELVPIESSSSLVINNRLRQDRRYCRPWARQFLVDISSAYYDMFHSQLTVTSAVRTVEQQHKLRRVNGNAAPDNGDTASSHLAGIAVDIAKRPLTRRQHQWVVDYLKRLRDSGMIEVAEERRQACFHIMVRGTYGIAR